MKTQASSRILGATFLCLVSLLVSNAKGLVIVDFDGDDYATSNFAFMNGYASGTSTVAYSDSVYRNPTSNYIDTSASAKFYGGAITTGTSGITTYRVANTNPDTIQVGSNSQAASVSNFVFWDQADFLNLSSGDVSLTSSTSINLTLDRGTLSGRAAEARLVIRQSGNYYISSLLGTVTGSTPNVISLSDPTSLSWFNYDPFTDVSVIGSSTVLGSLGGLTGIGLQGTGTATGTATPNLQFNSITFNAVPEPGSILLLGLGSGLLLLRRHRASVA